MAIALAEADAGIFLSRHERAMAVLIKAKQQQYQSLCSPQLKA